MSLWPQRPRKVRLQLKPDERGHSQTIEGVLTARTRREFVLLTPKMVEAEQATISLLGSVEVPRENVLFYQVLS